MNGAAEHATMSNKHWGWMALDPSLVSPPRLEERSRVR